MTGFVVLSLNHETSMRPELASPLQIITPLQRDDFELVEFNVYQPPLHGVSSVIPGLEPVPCLKFPEKECLVLITHDSLAIKYFRWKNVLTKYSFELGNNK
ncbi:hypothetical protein TNCV_2690331 [Trichonephila clavipes]|uniref:Uncharacterized protein n=1 Tax=Trichonephila clavipes TaxID=2585209 RepID=A0A8X7BBS5_TRICX|nr:hypothetical protein TNCV_2690331 [Trichonephila clavipes]